MFRQILNWRTALAVVAIFIVSGTIIYSQYLAKKIAREERQKVEQWIRASQFILTSPGDADITIASMIVTENTSIPIIETDEKDSITQHINLDSTKAVNNASYVKKKLKQFKSQNKAIEWAAPDGTGRKNLYYYGNSKLLTEIRYYPIVQLCIVALFIIITIFSIRSSYRSTQNQVWAGMAKETAHQLGTPVSSLEGWVEMLKEKSGNEKIVQELGKDVDRLRLVSDRFGKIGSTPHLEEMDLVSQINSMVDYMRKRATGKINFSVKIHGSIPVIGKVSAPLFDWVIENLLKNALDAMEGKGSINVDVSNGAKEIYIDIADTGKGISKQNIAKVFKPGFTTKKRGWGLGLSLSRRIIEQYHKGQIFVKQSEIGKGTTFRIVLKK
ncbi:MAG: HAMP domain-containing histidine kinase [Chitinophagaceae bacterium]|jgi:K+-sensing histidine kinase KdpD|nr:HAMP domain-containing histidine kinase [Chitinophagaceae bacterium]MBK7678226.1 HAMP domain-containing histidine kinase [Chitinophagaceae bacterium]MBK8301570.1 HAMP domain-containing histidine kinase [Chitinophagaceae bacterium]MBK9939185.1 HAMP domain-containing histidine kinase [Chitinophagaceae bacterium]HQW43612.1 HAMP domain-containing sensor histidine kinase [Chitinophagaceae bacterium]